MANNNNKKKSNSNNNSSSSSKLPLNKISFFVIGAVAILYLLAGIFSAIKLSIGVDLVAILQTIANIMLIGIVSILGWRYVAKKQTVWKVLYIVFILVILVGIVLPLVF